MLNNQNLIKTAKEKYPAESRIHLGNMEESNVLALKDLKILKMYIYKV